MVARDPGPNPKLATGEIYVRALDLIMNTSNPAFYIEDGVDRMKMRLKYRYLDLRRPEMQKSVAAPPSLPDYP